MKKAYLLSFFLLFSLLLTAQDAYHSTLQMQLAAEYNLPAAEFAIADNEADINNSSYTWFANRAVEESSDTDFSQKIVLTSTRVGANPWDEGWGVKNKARIAAGDRVLIVFQVRSVGGTGDVNVMAENATTYAQEVFLTLNVSETWTTYYIPFQSNNTFGPDGMQFGMHLAKRLQTIELGGFTVLNYKQNVALADLPDLTYRNQYEGFEADAPWRATAAERIEQLRKAPLNIEVKDSDGNPIPNAVIEVEMQQHEFGFGTAITAQRIAGNNGQNNIYQSRILDLDGRGHGFNWVVFENDLKWPAWEDNWFVSNAEAGNAVQWVKDQGLKLRGHTLVWPGLDNLPNDISQNTGNPDYIKNRVFNHMEEIMTYLGIEGNVDEWDVINETVTNRSLQNIFAREEGYTTGRELYVEIFEKAKEIDSNTGLWLNDFVTITVGNTGGGQYDSLKLYTQELIEAGAPIDGLGFQGHIGASPNGIPSVLATFDDFYDSFGLKAKVTEYDIDGSVSEELAANYLRDFMTATFSHPSMDGFLMWSFWDGAAWREGNNLFRRDWSRTPAADMFTDLVFNQWWTDETLMSDENGQIQLNAFKGDYEIRYECDGVMVSEMLSLSEAADLTINCDNIATSTDNLQASELKIYPNPAQQSLTLERVTSAPAMVRLMDMHGRVILEKRISSDLEKLDLDVAKGVYMLEVFEDVSVTRQKVILN